MSESTQTLTLTGFLLARIAEDEEWARTEAEGFRGWPNDPTRVLADCEAKRRIVEERQWHLDHAARAVASYDSMRQAERACKYLAAVYADHPDYREEWRP